MSEQKATFPYAAALVGGAILAGALAFVLINPSIVTPHTDGEAIAHTELTPRPRPEPKDDPEPDPEKEKKAQTYPPHYNFALAAHGAVAQGGKHPELLIDGNATHYSSGSGFATARLDTNPPEAFLVRLKECVFLRCIRFRLWDISRERFYRYKLEVSSDDSGTNWTVVGDKTHEADQCRSWQDINFDARVVKMIRLAGTHNSENSFFQVVEMEAYDDAPPLPPTEPPPTVDPKKQAEDLEF
jgi:hypothetical protein